MAKNRLYGEIQPGISWSWFTLRIPFVHVRLETPELIQGLLVAGATGLAIVPLYIEYFGMSFETAVAMCALQVPVVCSAFLIFGDPYGPGWLTPALPLVLREILSQHDADARTEFVNSLVILVGVVFFLFGTSGLGKKFLRCVPLTLKSGIVLGAGMSAIYGEFVPRQGGRPSRFEEYTVCILLAVGITLLLLFSTPLEKWKQRFKGMEFLASLGIAPGFFTAMVVGPWVGELSYQSFKELFFSPTTGEWVFRFDDVLFLPNFEELFSHFSILSRGIPDSSYFISAVPLALAAYVIGFGDIITGTAILNDAARDRKDEKIPIDEHRTHLSVGIRNIAHGLIAGPFFPLHGPLWTGATVVVAERYRRGRKAMDSIFSGIFSYYLFGIPLAYFFQPLLALVQPVLDVALSLTLTLTGFTCAYVALAMPRNRTERGLVVLIGMVIMHFSTLAGIAVGLLTTGLLLGREGWRDPKETQL